MGTTRMHEDPKQGVLDADARVHGIDNLFVASACGLALACFTEVSLRAGCGLGCGMTTTTVA